MEVSQRWMQRLWINKPTIKVLQQNGLQCPAVPGCERGDSLLCYIHFSAPYSVRLPVEPCGYVVRFGEQLHYFASLDAEREYNFRLYNKRVLYSVSIPDTTETDRKVDALVAEKDRRIFPFDIGVDLAKEAEEILKATRERMRRDHLKNLARKHPRYFRDRIRPMLEQQGVDGYRFVFNPDEKYEEWATEFPAEFKGEPAAYEVLIHEDDASAVSALLAEVFEDIQPLKLLDGYQLSCIKPLHGFTMTEAIRHAKTVIAKYID